MSGVSIGVLLNWSVHTAGISALKGTCDFIRRGTEWANSALPDDVPRNLLLAGRPFFNTFLSPLRQEITRDYGDLPAFPPCRRASVVGVLPPPYLIYSPHPMIIDALCKIANHRHSLS